MKGHVNRPCASLIGELAHILFMRSKVSDGFRISWRRCTPPHLALRDPLPSEWYLSPLLPLAVDRRRHRLACRSSYQVDQERFPASAAGALVPATEHPPCVNMALLLALTGVKQGSCTAWEGK